MKCGNFAGQEIHCQGETDYRQPIGNQNVLDIGVRIDVAVNVAGQADVLLPEHDPVAGEEHQKPHEAADPGQHDEPEAQPRSTRGR